MYKICVFGMITCVLLEPVFTTFRESVRIQARETAFTQFGQRVTAHVSGYAKQRPGKDRRQVPFVILPPEFNMKEEVAMTEAISAVQPGKDIPVICYDTGKGWMIRPEQDSSRILRWNMNRAACLRKASLLLLLIAAFCLAVMGASIEF